MSALSKLSTMKRPRWPGGTGGAVGGAAGMVTAGGGAACVTARGASVRGPTDSGGVDGAAGAGGVDGSTTGTGSGGTASLARGARDPETQPLSSVRATTAAMLLLTSLLRGIGRLRLRKATQEIRGQRTTSGNDRRRARGDGRGHHARLPRHLPRDRGNDRRHRRWNHAGQPRLRAGRLSAGRQRHASRGGSRGRPRLARIAQPNV